MTSQNKSSTDSDTSNVPFSTIKGKATIRVATFFREHPDEQFTPKQLALLCNVGHSNAKKICTRFHKHGWIQKTLVNHYVYVQKITAEELHRIESFLEIKYHNMMLVVGNTSVHQSEVTHSEEIKGESSNRNYQCGTVEFVIYSVSVKICTYPQKRVVDLGCTENPVNYSELMRVIGNIEGKGYNLDRAYVERIEPNIDIPDLHLDGKRIELRTFQEVWQRYYQKKKSLLRKEYIIRGGHIPFEEALAAMRGEQTLGTNVVATKLDEVLKTQQQIVKDMDELRNRFDKNQKQK